MLLTVSFQSSSKRGNFYHAILLAIFFKLRDHFSLFMQPFPNTDIHALANLLPLNSPIGPTSTTYSSNLFQSFVTRTANDMLSMFPHALSRLFSRCQPAFYSRLSGTRSLGDRENLY